MAARRVPPEVWLQIIGDASYVPPCDMSSHDPLPSNGSYHILDGKLVVKSIREALSTKHTVSLVCRLWNSLIVEFLYEFIVVRDAVHIPLLVGQLSRVGTHITHRVQRIDFTCPATTRDVYYNGVSYNAKHLARAAGKLIRLCPRLRVLSSPTTLWERDNTTAFRSYTRFLANALMKVKDTLECLEWRSRWGLKSVVALSRVILPRLQVLLFSGETPYPYASSVLDEHWENTVTANHDSGDETLDREYPADRSALTFWTFSPLRTVDAEYYWNWTPSYDYNKISQYLSSLKHFIITSGPFWFHLQNQWSTLPQINTITFQKGAFRFVNSEGCSLPSTVNTIILHARDIPISPPSCPYVKRIGLMGMETSTSEEYDYVFNLFVGEHGSGDDHFPFLEMMRFVDTSLSMIVRKRELQFKLWERRCRSKSVRLEDEMGQVMTA